MTNLTFSFSFSLLLLSLLQCTTTTLAQAPASPPVPSGPPNITKILEKAGQFTILLRLLGTTQVGNQINNQLNDSSNAMTIFAPPDNAFSSLQSGTLNALSDQQKDELIQFHVVPTFLSISQFQTVSNPLRTQAGDSGPGKFPLNVTTSGNQVNITTGIVNTTVSGTIYTDNQLAVYQVDKVLLPWSIFGPTPPAPAPAPISAKKKKKVPAADVPSSDNADAAGAGGLCRDLMTVLVMSIGDQVRSDKLRYRTRSVAVELAKHVEASDEANETIFVAFLVTLESDQVKSDKLRYRAKSVAVELAKHVEASDEANATKAHNENHHGANLQPWGVVRVNLSTLLPFPPPPPPLPLPPPSSGKT
ncbi:hypothetical protein Vadar_025503 [Vaccinium darrowii]|uniref:Uncharacterized protein n=1 Tax=Vaccinium darrowii TaxID=229202 RepID=A0ACB7XCW0_9ERIC|nr:hypothetical protein Vadar_025503 [Vaccinium darrowii]